ncbi:MAG: Gfo/Idh/MocA family protein [Candidatus Hadarchaeum sp.]|uniref:Gfo/Idh/MocA family protein n=1 Tax=Candidatus Hadarchaeum sp. TaxID=2883567 RepID=UPI003D0B8D5F
MEKVGIGLAGLGFMARIHSRALAEIPKAEIVAAWSKFPAEHEKFKEFAAGLGFKVKKFYTEIEEMTNDPDVEAVICAVPPRFMETIASGILRAGKTALLECPPSDTPQGIDRLSELARTKNVRVMPGLCYRFAPCFRKVKDLLDAGEIGNPISISFTEFVPADSLARQWAPGSWAWNRATGGPIITMTIFCMDLTRWVLNSEPASLTAKIDWLELPKYGTWGYRVFNAIKFRNDVVWTNMFASEDSSVPGPPLRMEITGESGTIIVDGPEKVILKSGGRVTEYPLKLSRPEKWGHKPEDEYFLKSVALKGEEPLVKLSDAKKALEMSLAILKSSQSDSPAYFDS